jgi:hypothetical protein
MSIKLYDPKTKVVQVCAARGNLGDKTAVLSGAVEACARQLEAHGFVRSESPP